MNFVKRFLEWREESDGFLTKTGKLISIKEWHSIAFGLMAGIGRKTEETCWQRDQNRATHALEWKYYHYGYLGANRVKWNLPQGAVVIGSCL